MKRIVLLLLALVLVIDLAEDGCLAKARLVSPHSSSKLSFATPHLGAASNPDSSVTLQRPEWRGPPGQSHRQTSTPGVHHRPKLIDSFHLSSSGGLPL